MTNLLLIFLFLFSPSRREIVKQKIKEGAVLVDLRTEQEIKKDGSIKNAINIPFGTVDKKIDSLKKLNKPIIFFCESGGRSSITVNDFKDELEVIDAGGWREVRKILEEIK